jgi:hypothetical protein
MRTGENEGSDEQGREGLRMQRNEGGIPEEENRFEVLHGVRRYNRKNTEDEKGESHNEPKGREPCAIVQIVEIPYIGGEEEEFQSSLVIEEQLIPNHTGSCVESITPCVSP